MFMCCLTTPSIDKIIEARIVTQNVPRYNGEEIVWNEGRGRNAYIYRGADKSLAGPGMKQANFLSEWREISFDASSCREKKPW